MQKPNIMKIIYAHDKKAFLIKEEDDVLAEVPFPFSDMNHNGELLTVEEVEVEYSRIAQPNFTLSITVSFPH